MKLLKPAFVHNQERPIFSIDIHPKEQKFATVSPNATTTTTFFPAFIYFCDFIRVAKVEMIQDVSQFGIWSQSSVRKLNLIQMFQKFSVKCKFFSIFPQLLPLKFSLIQGQSSWLCECCSMVGNWSNARNWI